MGLSDMLLVCGCKNLIRAGCGFKKLRVMDSVKNVTVLFPIELEEFWKEMRRIVGEAIASERARTAAGDAGSSKLLKAKEVCELFQVSKPTLYEWMHKGQLRSVKIESRRFFLQSDIEELIERGRGGSEI